MSVHQAVCLKVHEQRIKPLHQIYLIYRAYDTITLSAIVLFVDCSLII